MAGLNKEVWIKQLLEPMRAQMGWLSEADDMSEHVENDTINLADAGVDPDVLINNTTYPIPIVARTDNPIALPLDIMRTENTVVRDAETIWLSYNKLESVLRGHRNALLTTGRVRAAHAYAPAGDNTYTPVIQSTGSLVSARRLLKLEDLSSLKKRFDDFDAPEDNRIVLLSSAGADALRKQDISLFKEFMKLPAGGYMNLFGFKIYPWNRQAVYDGSLAKKALNAVAAPSTDRAALVTAFVGSEVMRAEGSLKMFTTGPDDAQIDGTAAGFRQAFIALPKRDMAVATIIEGA
jgi:hypothetical protein